MLSEGAEQTGNCKAISKKIPCALIAGNLRIDVLLSRFNSTHKRFYFGSLQSDTTMVSVLLTRSDGDRPALGGVER
jgi:hypothetical protein